MDHLNVYVAVFVDGPYISWRRWQ